jgi:hypothetical protein
MGALSTASCVFQNRSLAMKPPVADATLDNALHLHLPKPDLTLPAGDLYPLADGAPQGWGITFMQANGTATGRSEGTIHWAGLTNLWWWCDRGKSIAGMVATQILPFGDGKVLELWGGVEAAVYKTSKA